MAHSHSSAPLDRPLARGLAAGMFVACLGLLAWLERERLFRSEAVVDADDPVQLCIAERAAGIDAMLAEGVIEAPQAELFKARAAAMCQDIVGDAGGGPALPPLPAQ
jgi:hypothetical protein